MLRFIGSLILFYIFIKWVISKIKEAHKEKEIEKKNNLIFEEFNNFNLEYKNGLFDYQVSLLCFLSKSVFPNKKNMNIINNLKKIIFDDLSIHDLNIYSIVIDLSDYFNQQDVFFCVDGSTGFILSSKTIVLKGIYFLFKEFRNIESISFNGRLSTENIQTMRRMFYDCRGLQSLDLGFFDTSNVTDMVGMFYNCRSLQSLDLSSFDTSNVTDMNDMFSSCSSLQSLDLASFDTKEVKIMDYVFSYCSSLQSLDLSSFDTSNVIGMSGMFYECSSLQSINLTSFKTYNCIYMYRMFSQCSSLQSLDLSSFEFIMVKNMAEMFLNCKSLQSIKNIESLKRKAEGTKKDDMFKGCSIKLKASQFF